MSPLHFTSQLNEILLRYFKVYYRNNLHSNYIIAPHLRVMVGVLHYVRVSVRQKLLIYIYDVIMKRQPSKILIGAIAESLLLPCSYIRPPVCLLYCNNSYSFIFAFYVCTQLYIRIFTAHVVLSAKTEDMRQRALT